MLNKVLHKNILKNPIYYLSFLGNKLAVLIRRLFPNLSVVNQTITVESAPTLAAPTLSVNGQTITVTR
jgi:hypothetical protein